MRPRLYTPELRPLTRKTSLGYELADFAEQVIGEPLLPWQRSLAIRGLELNPDGGFRYRTVIVLVARQNGKTAFLQNLALWRMFIDGARLVLGSAQTLAIARECWLGCVDRAKGVSELQREVAQIRYANGEQEMALTSGSRYKIVAANRNAPRGLSVDLLLIDEIREHRAWDAWGALSKTTIARPRAQIWAASNAGDEQSVVLNQLRETALSGADPSTGIFEWSAPDGCALDDMEGLRQANPGLGYTISLQALESARAIDPPAVYRTEVLCQRVDHLDSAIDVNGWKAGTDTSGTMDSLRDRVCACVDIAPDGQHVTLLAGAETTDGRVRLEVVEAWNSTEAARRELPEVLERVKPRALGWFPSGPAAALAPILRELGAHEIKGAAVNEACMSFADLVTARRIVHSGDPLLNAHVAGASKLPSGDGWRFTRNGAGHVDAAYAAAGVVHVVLTVPEEVPIPRPMVV